MAFIKNEITQFDDENEVEISDECQLITDTEDLHIKLGFLKGKCEFMTTYFKCIDTKLKKIIPMYHPDLNVTDSILEKAHKKIMKFCSDNSKDLTSKFKK